GRGSGLAAADGPVSHCDYRAPKLAAVRAGPGTPAALPGHRDVGRLAADLYAGVQRGRGYFPQLLPGDAGPGYRGPVRGGGRGALARLQAGRLAALAAAYRDVADGPVPVQYFERLYRL